jgi:hypothetical protein
VRNKYAGRCYQCGRVVLEGTGHFERHKGGWRVKHANIPGHGRITCDKAVRREVVGNVKPEISSVLPASGQPLGEPRCGSSQPRRPHTACL